MERKNKRKGFTIVELVIVIAVIGVLTAILVPTFIGLTQKANEASDDSLVTNLNKALAIHEATPGDTKNITPQDAIDDLKAEGYLADVLVTKSEKTLVWCDKDNRFHLANDTGVEELPAGATNIDCWGIYKSMPSVSEQRFSIYAASDWTDSLSVAALIVGFDCGEHTDFTSITYSTDSDQTAIIRTNSGDLTVNAPNGTVEHYGVGNILTVSAIAPLSYDEYGVFSSAALESGHIHVQEGGYIAQIAAAAGQKVTVDGSADKVTGVTVEASSTGYVADNNGTGSKGDASKGGYLISNLDELKAFRDSVNNGSLLGVTAQLVADIDLTGEAWKPIGNTASPYYGTFNGNNHTIKGLSNAGYSIDTADIWTTDSTGHTGAAYGFFGLIGSKVGSENVTIHDLVFTDVNIDVALSNAVGVVAGADTKAAKVSANGSYAGDISFSNISVSGTQVKGEDSIAAIFGKCYTLGSVSVTDCQTDISVITTKTSKKVAGLIGMASNAASVIVKDNAVKGNVYLGAIDSSKNIGGGRNYINMTVNTGARFGKAFVFGDSVNTVTGKMYVGTTEYLDPFTTSYTFNEDGEATSATFDYIPVGDRVDGKSYLANNLITMYDGAIVNGLYMNDGTNDNGKSTSVNTFGTVVMNDCYVKGTYNSELGGNLTLNNCSGQYVKSQTNYGLGNVTSTTGGLVTINGGDYTLKTDIQNCLTDGRARITVTSGRFSDGYVAQNVPGSTLSGSSAWIGDAGAGNGKSVTYNDVTYTIVRGSGNVWIVTNAPAA